MSEQPFFFTWSAQRDASPVEITGGEGIHFDTPEGRWLDLNSLVWQMNLGYGRQDIVEALKAQAERLCFAPPNALFPEKEELARRLLSHAPKGYNKVFFTLGGAEANENAFKIARMVTGRHKVISRYHSYHGATLGAVSATGDWRRAEIEPAMPGFVHVLDFDDGDMKRSMIPRTLELEKNVGAVILETIGGKNGAYIPDAEYYRNVQKACREHGALLIADEVLVGCCRTGKFLAVDHYPGYEPDMITLAKGLTAGYGTLGAVLVHERVSRHFDERVLACGLTHYGHPLGVAAALASVKAYETEELAAKTAQSGWLLTGLLDQLEREHACVKSTRSIGLLGAFEVASELIEPLRDAFAAERIHIVANSALNLFFISPPLVISADELTAAMTRVSECISNVASAKK